MKPHEIKCAVVGRMYEDRIIAGIQYADVETVARHAVPPAYVGDAEDEIDDYMLPNDDCPVHEVMPGVITLEDDDEKIKQYLERHCDDTDDLPPSVRDSL